MNDRANSSINSSPTDEDCFLFTSESVGEGHPGEFFLFHVCCLALMSLLEPDNNIGLYLQTCPLFVSTLLFSYSEVYNR